MFRFGDFADVGGLITHGPNNEDAQNVGRDTCACPTIARFEALPPDAANARDRAPPERDSTDGTSSRFRAGFHHLYVGRSADTGYWRSRSQGAAGPGAHRHFRAAQSGGRGRDYICAGHLQVGRDPHSSGGTCVYQTGHETLTVGEDAKGVVVEAAYVEQRVPLAARTGNPRRMSWQRRGGGPWRRRNGVSAKQRRRRE